MNQPIHDAVEKMSSDSACLSDAARSWLQIQSHFEEMRGQLKTMSRVCQDSAHALRQQMVDQVQPRFEHGMRGAQYLALFVDPRPSMRAFVKSNPELIGEPPNLGNTDALKAAKEEIKTMCAALSVAEFPGVGAAKLAKAGWVALTVFLGVCPFLRWLSCILCRWLSDLSWDMYNGPY